MNRSDHVIKDRLEKLAQIERLQKDAFPAKTDRNFSCAEALTKKSKDMIVSGRIVAIRLHGKVGFADIEDDSGKMQIFVRFDEVGEKNFGLLELLDIGDFIEAKGDYFITKSGEPSLKAAKIKVLSKALKQVPEKHQIIKSKEELYRKRYLDLLTNPETKKIFKIRSKFLKEIRNYLEHDGFIEVETPILQNIPGGALAKPFKAHYNEYHTDVYLRVAPELYLKRLIVGGYEKVFEVAKCFRNECADWSHNPEFTQVEFYVAYMDYNGLMDFTEKMIREIIKKVTGKFVIEKDGQKIDFSKKFKRITFKDVSGGKMTDNAFKEGQKKLIQPTFVMNHPLDISPLAKKNDDKTAQRFQLVVAGLEVINAYSELNNPIEQRERFEEQMQMREEGNEEAARMDEDFIEALEYGMPPTAGWGLGVDRFISLITDSHTIRQVIAFPFMKSKTIKGEKNNA